MRRRPIELLGFAALLALWALIARSGLIHSALLPGPLAVGRELVRLLPSGEFLRDLFSTVGRVAGALSIAAVIGIPAGLAMGVMPRFGRGIELPLDLYRSVPAVALIPLFVVLLGIGESAKVVVGVGAVLPILLLNAAYGARAGSATRRRLVRSLGMTRWQALRLVVFPGALPHLFAGLRVAVSAATTVAVASEMLVGARHGLGRRIYDAQLLFRIPELYATVLSAGALGYGLNRIILLVERRALHWQGR